jgi:hypothetical protein
MGLGAQAWISRNASHGFRPQPHLVTHHPGTLGHPVTLLFKSISAANGR